MAALTGLITTYTSPNYTGELFQIKPTTAPFLTMIGGLAGAMETTHPQFEWESVDLRTSVVNNVVLEGQAAPTAVGRSRSNITNVCEVHQSQIQVSYTKQAAFGQMNGINTTETNPVVDEVMNQTELELIAMKRDINQSFLTGVYNLPTDNTTKRQTRGIITAVTTNLQDAAALGGQVASGQTYTSATNGTITTGAAHGLAVGATFIPQTVVTNTEVAVDTPYYVLTVPTTTTLTLALTKGGSTVTFAATGSGTWDSGVAVTDTLVGGLLQSVFDNGGLTENETFTVFVNSAVKIGLSRAYIKSYGSGYFPQSATVGGVSVDRIMTDFGMINVVVDRQIPKHKALFATLSECQPVFLNIPDKGHLFVEPLARTGAFEPFQIYGEIGLAYGIELHHGVLKNLAAF